MRVRAEKVCQAQGVDFTAGCAEVGRLCLSSQLYHLKLALTDIL